MDKNQFQTVIAGLTDFPSIKPHGDRPKMRRAESGIITTHDQVQVLPEYSVYSPMPDTLYPGALLDGAALQLGVPESINIPRGPGTVYRDGGSRASVSEVGPANINEARVEILNKDYKDPIPARLNLFCEEVQSEEELGFDLKINVDYMKLVGINASLKLDTNTKVNHLIVALRQDFYPLVFEAPGTGGEFFRADVNVEDLRTVCRGHVPAYISQINYGRIFMLLIESTSSATTMKAAAGGSFSQEGVTGGGSVDANAMSKLSNLQVKLFAYGGMDKPTLTTAGEGVTGFKQIVAKLADASDIKTGLPLSYLARSLKTNAIVKCGLIGKYDTWSPLEVTKDSSIRLLGSDGRYIGSAAACPRYYYPTLQSNGAYAAHFTLGGGKAHLQHGDNVPLIVTETDTWAPNWRNYNYLGGFADSSDLYYWTLHGSKTNWIIERADGPGAISYGDDVYLKNESYGEYMAPAKDGYLTTTTANYAWTIAKQT